MSQIFPDDPPKNLLASLVSITVEEVQEESLRLPPVPPQFG